MVYERLAGRTPEPPPPLALLAAALPRELADLIDRCLAFSSDARPSARDIAAAFDRAAT